MKTLLNGTDTAYVTIYNIQGGPKKTIPKLCRIYILNSTPVSAQNVSHYEQ